MPPLSSRLRRCTSGLTPRPTPDVCTPRATLPDPVPDFGCRCLPRFLDQTSIGSLRPGRASSHARSYANARGVRLALIYDATNEARSDEQWTNQALSHAPTYELGPGGEGPDIAALCSRGKHPQMLLPEPKFGTFTNLIDRYWRLHAGARAA